MLKSLSEELLSEGLLAQDDTVVMGVSGGPDSMALLHLLRDLNKTLGWNLKLHVAHLNHLLRGREAEEDAAFVHAAADHFSLPCTIESCDIESMAGNGAPGIEETSRGERYEFFERVADRIGAQAVAVGHHADDNAETILHRIARGTGLRGLVGIPRKRRLSATSNVNLIRPLLHLTAQEIRAYLANVGVAYREDRTNAGNEPIRNRIRNLVLPQLESEVNPQVREALTRLGEQARWVQEYLHETVQRTFETLVISQTDQELTLNADALARKSRIVQTELVRLAYRSFGLGEQDLSFSHMVSALDLIADPGSGRQLTLPGGMTIEKRYHQLTFSLPSTEPRETVAAEIAVRVPGQTLLPIRRLQIDCAIGDVRPEDIPRLRRTGDRMIEYVDFDSVRPPLVIRKRRSGDRFFPLGAPGSKKLSDFLTGAKVDPKERERVAVLCDHLGPIWVIGHRIDERVKMTALTRRVLHLRAKPLEP